MQHRSSLADVAPGRSEVLREATREQRPPGRPGKRSLVERPAAPGKGWRLSPPDAVLLRAQSNTLDLAETRDRSSSRSESQRRLGGDDSFHANATGTTSGRPGAHTYAIPVQRGGSARRSPPTLLAERETQAAARRRAKDPLSLGKEAPSNTPRTPDTSPRTRRHEHPNRTVTQPAPAEEPINARHRSSQHHRP
jgi:hypothetical protein